MRRSTRRKSNERGRRSHMPSVPEPSGISSVPVAADTPVVAEPTGMSSVSGLLRRPWSRDPVADIRLLDPKQCTLPGSQHAGDGPFHRTVASISETL